MANLARGLLMLIAKFVMRIPGMVKCYRLPILLGMTSLTLVAVISFMAFFLINFTVTSGTGQLQLFPGRFTGYTIFVASLAFRVLMLALKGILGILVMVET